jgi:DNA-binding NtrC family response regulator
MSHEKILIVEDEENERSGLAELVTSWGFRVETARDGAEGLDKATQWSPSIVITDLKMPRMGGIELLGHLAEQSTTIAVILVTAQGTIDSAVQAMRMGAYDYITKPIDTNRLRTMLGNAAALLGTRAELEATRRRLRDAGSLGRLNGGSRKMQEIFRLIEMVAPSTASVLITGASGTGKELVARTIHELSPRKDRPFVAINCAAIPETLMESEIFGHEKGAFTGAIKRVEGAFERADGGTLLLDEISEMRLDLQAKLLRVLQEQEFERVGGSTPIKVDVRIIATTNRDLAVHAAAGHFRQDLFYRLSVIPIRLPPLRERREDITLLAHRFATQYAGEIGKPITGIAPQALELLLGYDWPGNVRELQHAVERAVILSGEPVIPAHAFDARRFSLTGAWREQPSLAGPDYYPANGNGNGNGKSVGATADNAVLLTTLNVDEAEAKLIERALVVSGGNRTRAADMLGISVRTLRNKLNGSRANGDRGGGGGGE